MCLAVLAGGASAFASAGASAGAIPSRSLARPATFYDITDTDTAGDSVDFSQFKGKVAYCVNVASR